MCIEVTSFLFIRSIPYWLSAGGYPANAIATIRGTMAMDGGVVYWYPVAGTGLALVGSGEIPNQVRSVLAFEELMQGFGVGLVHSLSCT